MTIALSFVDPGYPNEDERKKLRERLAFAHDALSHTMEIILTRPDGTLLKVDQGMLVHLLDRELDRRDKNLDHA